MTRRNLLKGLAGGLSLPWAAAQAAGAKLLGQLQKPREFWQPLLSPQAFDVLFHEATEYAGSSPLNKEKRAGTYVCAACHLPLFTHAMKYDSGTGWPSFFTTLPGVFGTSSDRKLFYVRTEYHCIRCGGHHGHVFDDGPQPTGLRYCNNGVALRFVPDGETLPALRGQA